MKLVKQKNNYACAVTSLFMLNDNKDYRRIKKFCKRHLKYNPNKGDGVYIDSEKICEQLNMLGIGAYIPPAGCKPMTAHTKYNRAMVLVYSNTKGHCIAWNGYCCYDPSENETYPDKLIGRKNPDYPDCTIIVFKTPLYERVINFIKSPFYILIH